MGRLIVYAPTALMSFGNFFPSLRFANRPSEIIFKWVLKWFKIWQIWQFIWFRVLEPGWDLEGLKVEDIKCHMYLRVIL